jgi:hypothetical protein
MSDTPPAKWIQPTRQIVGLILVLAALWLLYGDGTKAWTLWKMTHPTQAVAAPASTNHPAIIGKLAPAKPAVAKAAPAKIPTDVITKLGTWLFAELIALFVGLWLLMPPKKKADAPDVNEFASAMSSTVKAAQRPAKRWQSCNVLQVGADNRRLWSFNLGKNGFALAQQQVIPAAAPLPANAVGRDWKTLFQPKLNIAWLPIEQVFLRVAQLPVSDLAETLAMVELQLEKLSPLPATQIVWSVEILPKQMDNLQTVIVVMVARDLVEKYLGELENIGYLADRLELPMLDQLLSTPIKEDGAYIYPDETTGKFTALVAWWYGGILRSIGLLHLPATEARSAVLKEQLAQMAWSGELEGWLNGEPRWHLVAEETAAANWQPMFQTSIGQPAGIVAPLAAPQLATLNANRSARAGQTSGILPAEYALRYQQEFHDRLWMRGLGAIVAVYVAFVMIYLGASAWQGMKADASTSNMSGLARTYTNALQLKAQLEILQNRETLKFAALDCWSIVAGKLPEGVTVQDIEFKGGNELSLNGVATGDNGSSAVTDFNAELRTALSPSKDQPNQLMFDEVTSPVIKLNPGGASLSWNFSCKLARAEELK